MNAHSKHVDLVDTRGQPLLVEETGRDLVQVEETQGQPQSLLEVISRAAADPNFDVDKLERLLAAQERIEARDAKRIYLDALAELQPALPEIDRKGRIVVTDKADASKPAAERRVIQSTQFARWEDIHQAISPLLHEHGFSLSFKPGVAQDGKVEVTATLAHRAGHSEQATVTLPHDSTGSKNAVQAVGSAISYGKRYAATNLLNIRTRGDDDDGKAAGEREGDPNNWITVEQVHRLSQLMEEAGADRDRFLNHLQIDTLAHLPTSRFQDALRLLAEKKAANARQGGER